MRAVVLAALCALAAACGSSVREPPAPPPCELACRDSIAVRAIRETMKLAFNLTLQGKPVGPQDATTPCPLGGSVRITGTASSNAFQGATDVDLTYALDGCAYVFRDDDAEDNYSVTLRGTVRQRGTLAVQPTATSALVIESDSLAIVGTVHDPPVPIDEECPLRLGQNGNVVSGTFCGRETGADL